MKCPKRPKPAMVAAKGDFFEVSRRGVRDTLQNAFKPALVAAEGRMGHIKTGG